MKATIIAVLLLVGVAVSQTATPTFEELSAKGRQAYESNRTDEAVDLYTRAVKLRPDWAQGWWALGMIAYERDRYAECRDALTTMVALEPAAAPGWALLGLCEFRTKQYDESFQHLKKAHMLVSVKQGRAPLLDMADYHLGMLLTRQGAFEVAQEVLMQVALTVKNNPDMMFAAGVTSLRMSILPSEVPDNQKDVVTMAGKAFWDLANRPPEEAEASFGALVAKHPTFPNVHYFYGTYLAAKHPEQCVPEFLQELHISPESVPARVQLALRYLVERKTDEALKMAREAVKLSPDSAGSQLALAQALKAQGNDEEALEAFLAAKRIDSVSPKIRLFLVNAYRALGRTEEMRREQAEYERLKAEAQNWP